MGEASGRKKILMLGGAWSQVPAIQRARELGCYVITCDYLPDNPGHAFADKYVNVSTVDREAVLALAREEGVQGVIAYASDPSAAAAAYVSGSLQLPGASYESVRLLSEKDRFRQFQREQGFCTPWFVTLRSAEGRKAAEELEAAKERVSYPCVVKPVDSSGSKGVARAEDAAQLEAAVRSARSFSRCGRVIIEEFISSPYDQLHGDGVVCGGRLVFLALGDQRFRNSAPIGSSLPSRLDGELTENVRREVERFIGRSGFTDGGINVEARVTGRGEIYLIEIGPRTGGNYIPQLMELATGQDEVTAVLRLALGEPCAVRMPRRVACCFQYIIGSGQSGFFREIFVDEYIRKKLRALYVHKRRGEWIGAYENSSGVAGVALLEFGGPEEMEHDIRHIGEHIRVLVEGRNEEG